MMMTASRRDLFRAAGAAVAARNRLFSQDPRVQDWIKSARILNAEAYNPPFYPAYTYNPERAVQIARDLNADTFRYPTASYYAYFPTKSNYPVHPELQGDPMKETLALARKAGLKTIAYIPLNHPFMEVESDNPRFTNWRRYDSKGTPLTTHHYGFGRYYEGCLNSPLRAEIFRLTQEVLTYDFDLLYFDGPYQGMEHGGLFCHCRWCKEAYRKAKGREIPREDGDLEDVITYTGWMRDDVCTATLQELVQLIKERRGLPVLYNNTSLLGRRQWRSRSFSVTDGFMFEAADTPEQKLFNLQLGQSTGKYIWTYVGHHTQYSREHLVDKTVRGWYSFPVDGDELLIDGATALAAGAGMVYWSLSRFHSMPKPPLEYREGKMVREIFDTAQKQQEMLQTARSSPQAGVLVGAQTIDWYAGKIFVQGSYGNGFRGAWNLMKELCIEAEPFLDYQCNPDKLKRYRLVYAPNAACLSDTQCKALAQFVENGGTLIATHRSGVCNEYGRIRSNPPLHELLGIKFTDVEPEERPDLYLQIPGREELIPQDPQITRFEVSSDATILASTVEPGHRRNLGPAVTRRRYGKGEAIYIGSSLEAVYEETQMPSIRQYLSGLLEPRLASSRRYRLKAQPGLLPHFLESPSALYLHLIANTGNKLKKLRARESYLPMKNIRVDIRMPQRRTIRSVSLMRAGSTAQFELQNGWLRVTVPQVFIHEAVVVQLA